jgi:integrase
MPAYKRGNKWSFRVYYDDPLTSKRKQYEKRGFESKKEAKVAEVEFLNSIKHNTLPAYVDVPFRLAYEYYLTEKKKEWKETSYYGNKIILDSRILTFFEKYSINKITKSVINEWRNSLDLQNFRKNYKNKLLTNLRGIFKYANINFNINNHVMDNEPGFKNDSALVKEKGIYNEEEFLRFTKAINDIRYKTFFYLLFYTGMRVGEIRAITWNDVDLIQGSISVNKTITNKIYDNDYKIIRPKTESSVRKIYFPTNIINPILIDYKEYCKVTHEFSDNQFVFGIDRPLAETTIRRQNILYAKRASLEPIRIHDFRHSYITMLYHKNVDMVIAKDQVGHSSIKTTADIYLKLSTEKRREGINHAFS